MKLLKVFSIFVFLHVAAWVGAHVYRSANPDRVLVVADTSFAMKPKFSAMQDWIESFEASSRYQRILIGTDKAQIGELAELKSKESIFRTVFGKMSTESLQRYADLQATEKILLSDGSVRPDGWTVITF